VCVSRLKSPFLANTCRTINRVMLPDRHRSFCYSMLVNLTFALYDLMKLLWFSIKVFMLVRSEYFSSFR